MKLAEFNIGYIPYVNPSGYFIDWWLCKNVMSKRRYKKTLSLLQLKVLLPDNTQLLPFNFASIRLDIQMIRREHTISEYLLHAGHTLIY